MTISVLRLCRAFPREDFPGVGLQPFYLARFSKYKSTIFTKYIDSDFRFDDDLNVYQVKYNDIPYKNTRKNVLIFMSKVYGDIYMFFSIILKFRSKILSVDVIHVHSIHYLITSLILKTFLKIPIVLSLGGTDLKRLATFSILKQALSRVDYVVYVAKNMEDNINKVFPDTNRMHISNGVDHSIFKNENRERGNYFIAVGNIRWQKGYEYLVESFYELQQNNINYKLYIVGDLQDAKSLKLKIYSLGLENVVILLGIKSQTEINRLLNESCALVMSSVSEGLPKVLIESICTGTPVVVTNVGDCAEVARNNGIIVESKNSQQLTEAMSSLVNNQKLWGQYHKNCLLSADLYSWNSMSKKIDFIYKKLSE